MTIYVCTSNARCAAVSFRSSSWTGSRPATAVVRNRCSPNSVAEKTRVEPVFWSVTRDPLISWYFCGGKGHIAVQYME